MKVMANNKFFTFLILLAALVGLTSCTDRPDRMFHDFFVSVADETGSETSRVLSTDNNMVATYYFNLVSEERTEPLTVYFDVILGDGLKDGVDLEFQTANRSITFQPGIYKRPFRINYLNHTVDPNKDNTVTIVIKETSDPNIIIGYPGPSAKFSKHVITKHN